MAKKKGPATRSRSSSTRRGAARRAAAGKSQSPAPTRDRRKNNPETLRLRALQPTLTVNDVNRSIRFYTDVLGFIVGERWTGDDGTLRSVMLKAGACEIALAQDDWKKGRDRKKGEGFSLWCTTAQDVDALAVRIKAAGGTLADGPTTQPWGSRSLSVNDPDGFKLTIYRES